MFLAASQLLLLAAYLMPSASSHPCGPETNNAIFFLTNDQTNSVVSIPIGADGKLSGGTVTGTGGAGSNSIDGKTNKPASPDPLIGQSAIAVAGQVRALSPPDYYVPCSQYSERLRRERWKQHVVDAGN